MDVNAVGGIAVVGGLVGSADANCTIDGCLSAVSMILSSEQENAGTSYMGGIAGKNDGTIDDCPLTASSGTLDASGAPVRTYFSGIAGYSSGTISSCKLSGASSFSATPAYAGTNDEGAFGGIAGRNAGIIDGCGNEMLSLNFKSPGKNVTIGGTAGENTGTIQYCSNTAAITITDGDCLNAGGITGAGDGDISECRNSGKISGPSTPQAMALTVCFPGPAQPAASSATRMAP